MARDALKVGELARRSGLTVRTLHHYDEIGLLKPSQRSETGYRLYSAEDVARLQQVLSLRQLGLSLEAIRECLDRQRIPPVEVIDLHLARLREQIALQQRVCERLEVLAACLRASERVSVNEILHTVEAMTMIENYYTPEQLEYLRQRRESVGEERLQQVSQEWEQLFQEVRAELERGTPPSDPRVRELAHRWTRLIEEFTGGDPGIRESLNRLYQEQGEQVAASQGYSFDPRLAEYINEALQATGEP